MIKQANKKPSTDKRMKSVWSSTYNVRKNKITVIKNRKWFWISRAKPWVIPAFSVPSSTPNHILSTNTRTCVCLSAESSFCFKGSIGVSTLWPFTMQTMYCLTWLTYFFKSSICLSIIKYLDTNKCFFCLKKTVQNRLTEKSNYSATWKAAVAEVQSQAQLQVIDLC